MARRVLWIALSLTACGSGGELSRCGSDLDCAAGTVCERPAAGEQGVCVAPYAVALAAPAAGAWIGKAAVTARATLRVQASGRPEPAALELLVGGAPAASLARIGAGLYEGSWVASPGTPATALLSAAAARGTADESRSAAVAVNVDLEAPVLGALSATCPAAPCVRDQVMRLQVAVADPHLAAVSASLDLEPARSVPLAKVGAAWQADVDLSGLPFPALARDVAVTLTATDAAGNQAVEVLPVPVTRVRWSYDAGAPVTSPAVMADGTLVVGLAATSNQVRALNPDGSLRWQATAGTGFISAAPSLGPTAIWLASMDGHIYALKLDGTGILNGSGCATGGAVQGAPAVGSGNPETAYAGSAAGRIYSVDSGATCMRSPLTDAFTASPAVDPAGAVLAATATATAILRQYSYDGAFTEKWSTSVGVNVSAPIAIDAAGNAWTGSQDAKLDVTTPEGATTTVRTLGGSIVDSPIVLVGGDVVVGDQARVLHRFRPDGTAVWAVEPVLAGPVLAPVALAGGPAALLVPTAAGTLHAVAADGALLWSGALTAGQSLREASIQAPGPGAFTTAYFGAADGKLYAVAVEGQLDTAAPWPKAHRDLRNSSNAAGPLP